jgi:NodT family efflux transporter outer membrane factor (OMF) lipoprotein
MVMRGVGRSGGRVSSILGLVVVASGCALQEPPTRQVLQQDHLDHVSVPDTWTAADTAAGAVQNGWLASFGDDQLLERANEALEHNPDMRVAAARVQQAAAYMRISGGALYPQVQAVGFTTTSQKDGASTDLSGWQFSVSWEIDLWGRVRYGARASESQYASAEADAFFARQSLVALVAKAWFTATESSLQRAIATDAVAAAERLLQLATTRQRVGVDSETDLVQARANLNNARDAARQIDLAYTQSLRALELLLGRYPAAEVEIAAGLPGQMSPVPAGVPSELLERRPDVIAAERRVAAAFDLVGQARAAQLPTLNLAASAIDVTSDLFVLDENDEVKSSVGAGLFAPLFRGGALKAQVDLRTAEQNEAMAAYAQTGLRAFAEVEDALAIQDNLRSRENYLAQVAADNSRALELEETRYRVGSRDLRSVTEQQLALYDARIALLRVQSEQRIQRVNLHLALGGDFAATPPVTTTPSVAAR